MPDGMQTASEEQSRRLPLLRLMLILAAVGALVLLGRSVGDAVPRFSDWVGSLGLWGPLVFMAGYAISVVAFIPASLLTLAAGAIFGVGWGTVYVMIAATVGAAGAFLVARYLARGAIEKRLANSSRFEAVDRAVGAQGRRIVFLLRLSPVFPFNLLNYALGLTRVGFADYLIASSGRLPGTLLNESLRKIAGDVAAVAGGAAPERGTAENVLLFVGLLATVVVTTLVTRIARRALAEATGD